MNASFQTPLVIAGRILLALIFVTSGFSKLTGIQAATGYIASVGLPMPAALAVGAGLLELLGGIALVVGFKARWAALALGVFTLLAGVLLHAYWSAPADQQFVQQLMFVKNLAIAGGLFMVSGLGAGPASFDGRLARV
jgi:putative oxidoreductase